MNDTIDIVELRQRSGLTREEFAVKLGVTLKTVADWETGKHSPSKLARNKIVDLQKELFKR